MRKQAAPNPFSYKNTEKVHFPVFHEGPNPFGKFVADEEEEDEDEDGEGEGEGRVGQYGDNDDDEDDDGEGIEAFGDVGLSPVKVFTPLRKGRERREIASREGREGGKNNAGGRGGEAEVSFTLSEEDEEGEGGSVEGEGGIFDEEVSIEVLAQMNQTDFGQFGPNLSPFATPVKGSPAGGGGNGGLMFSPIPSASPSHFLVPSSVKKDGQKKGGLGLPPRTPVRTKAGRNNEGGTREPPSYSKTTSTATLTSKDEEEVDEEEEERVQWEREEQACTEYFLNRKQTPARLRTAQPARHLTAHLTNGAVAVHAQSSDGAVGNHAPGNVVLYDPASDTFPALEQQQVDISFFLA